MAPVCWTVLATVCVVVTGAQAATGGFYVDNGLGQTILYPKISKRERREMQQEILSVLGLDHRPKPPSHETDTSAPRYMLDLYKNLIDEETGELRPNETWLDPELWHDDNSLHAIHDADIIMSFVNHGKKKRLKKCRRRKNRKRFPPARGANPTNWPVCKVRNNTNIRTAHERVHLRHEKDRRFWFDVSEVPIGEMLLGAELRLYKEMPTVTRIKPDIPEDANYTIAIYEIIQGEETEDRDLVLVDSTNITLDYDGWIFLNVSGSASKWLVFPETNLGLYLRIQADGKGRDLHPKDLHLIGGKGRHEHQPFMVAFFKTSQELHIRRTRAANKRQNREFSYNDADGKPWSPHGSGSGMIDMDRIQKRSCQKRTLYVSFKDLGWQDWIIAPEGYAAFYCNGECSFPLNAHMNATNHAIVQTLVHLMNPHQVPKPCCAPTKLTAISVLYFDDNSNVILKKYRNMVVKTCGCH